MKVLELFAGTRSIAAISHHRRKNPVTGNLDPVSDYAKFCDKTVHRATPPRHEGQRLAHKA